MTDFNYTVKQGDKGLTYIFLEKAGENGYSGDSSKINWNSVMSIFDEIQEEKQAQKEQQLYSGGNDKTRAGWGKSYKIKVGQIIRLSHEQIQKIYEAMGFKKTSVSPPPSQPEQPFPPSDTQETITADDIKVTVEELAYNKDLQNFAVEVETAKSSAKAVAKEIKDELTAFWTNNSTARELLKNVTPENAAYIVEQYPEIAEHIDDVLGMDKKDVWDGVLSKLVSRADEWYLLDDEAVYSEKMTLEEMKTAITDLSIIIQKNDNEILNARDDDVNSVDLHNSNIETVQQTFDDANDFLLELMNMEKLPPAKHTTYKDGRKASLIKLPDPDNRAIKVIYDDGGECLSIAVSYSAIEYNVTYYNTIATYNYDLSNNKLKGHITPDCYDFEKIKVLVEQILAKSDEHQ